MQDHFRGASKTCLHCGNRLKPWHLLYDSDECYAAGYEARFRERFWSKVDKSGDCWLWTGNINHQTGYGMFGRREDGRSFNGYAHRISYELAFGPIPEGLLIRHGCDVRACVRPEHLSAGTQRENIRDAIDRGRFRHIPDASKRQPTLAERARGERVTKSKLTTQDVIEIRRLWANRELSQDQIADSFRVKQSTISQVVLGKTWAHVI